MTTLVDVYRHHLQLRPGVADDAEIAGRLQVQAQRFAAWGNNAESIFSGNPEAFAAYEAGNVRAFADALKVPWPVPAPITLKGCIAELEATLAKLKAI